MLFKELSALFDVVIVFRKTVFVVSDVDIQLDHAEHAEVFATRRQMGLLLRLIDWTLLMRFIIRSDGLPFFFLLTSSTPATICYSHSVMVSQRSSPRSEVVECHPWRVLAIDDLPSV